MEFLSCNNHTRTHISSNRSRIEFFLTNRFHKRSIPNIIVIRSKRSSSRRSRETIYKYIPSRITYFICLNVYNIFNNFTWFIFIQLFSRPKSDLSTTNCVNTIFSRNFPISNQMMMAIFFRFSFFRFSFSSRAILIICATHKIIATVTSPPHSYVSFSVTIETIFFVARKITIILR